MESAPPSVLSVRAHQARSCVVPVLLSAARPAALRLPSDQSPSAAALERAAACAAAAVAWKSLGWSAVDAEKPPGWTSTQQMPRAVSGFMPETMPRRSRSLTARMTAPSGIAEVSKETTDLY